MRTKLRYNLFTLCYKKHNYNELISHNTTFRHLLILKNSFYLRFNSANMHLFAIQVIQKFVLLQFRCCLGPFNFRSFGLMLHITRRRLLLKCLTVHSRISHWYYTLLAKPLRPMEIKKKYAFCFVRFNHLFESSFKKWKGKINLFGR